MRSILPVVFFGFLALPVHAVPIPDDSIGAETVAAYEKIGGVYGGFKLDGFEGPRFVPGKQAATRLLPGFSIVCAEGNLPELPPVGVPFGLAFPMQVTDVDLKRLNNLTTLTSLNLGGTGLTDAGLKELHKLKNIATLNLAGNHFVTDAGLAELKKLENLTAINLGGTAITDAGLKELKSLKKLAMLGLDDLPVSAQGLSQLKELKDLTALDVSECWVLTKELKAINEFKNLTSLRLCMCSIGNDVDLKELTGLENLTDLDLSNTSATGFRPENFKNLRVSGSAAQRRLMRTLRDSGN